MLENIIFCQMQRQNLDMKLHPTPDEVSFLQNRDQTEPVNRMIAATFQCSRVVAEAHDTLRSPTTSADYHGRLHQIIIEANKLNTMLDQLCSVAVTETSKNSKDNAAFHGRAHEEVLESSHSPTFRSISIWIMYRSTRIILLQTLLQCSTTLQSFTSTTTHSPEDDIEISEESSVKIIKEMSNAIFSAIPTLTEDFADSVETRARRGPRNIGGYYLLWPLHVIVDCEYTSEDQKQIAREVLLRIGSEMGLNHAFEIARTDHKKTQ